MQELNMKMKDYAKFEDYYPINRGSFLGIATMNLNGKIQVRFRIIKSRSGHIFANLPTDRVELDGNTEYIPMMKFENEKFQRALCEYVVEVVTPHIDTGREIENFEALSDDQESLPF